jgi:hypothetical protein
VLPYKGFNGKINGKKIEDFYSQLDYSIKGVENRLKKIKEILKDDEFFVEYFDKWFKCNINSNNGTSENDSVCRLLEKMADYILYADRNSYRRKKYKEQKIKKKEILVDDLESYFKKIEERKEEGRNYRVNPIVKVSQEDINNYKEIKNIYEAIQLLEQLKLKRSNAKDKKKIKKAILQLKEDAGIIKEFLSGMIEFKRLGFTTTEYDFNFDTFYWDKNGEYKLVSRNALDFLDKNHIDALISFYSALKQSSFEDCQGQMKYILMFLEYLIDNAPLKNYERDYLGWYIDGLNKKQIIDKLKMKYGFDWSDGDIQRCKNIILDKIVKFYEDDYEEWFYTFKVKGKYKKCSKCGKIYLANKKYFRKDTTRKDGLDIYCKLCRKSVEIQ